MRDAARKYILIVVILRTKRTQGLGAPRMGGVSRYFTLYIGIWVRAVHHIRMWAMLVNVGRFVGAMLVDVLSPKTALVGDK